MGSSVIIIIMARDEWCLVLFTRKNSSERAICECKRPSSGKDRRNLVVCIDGTSNKFGLKVRWTSFVTFCKPNVHSRMYLRIPTSLSCIASWPKTIPNLLTTIVESERMRSHLGGHSIILNRLCIAKLTLQLPGKALRRFSSYHDGNVLTCTS